MNRGLVIFLSKAPFTNILAVEDAKRKPVAQMSPEAVDLVGKIKTGTPIEEVVVSPLFLSQLDRSQ